MTTQTKTATKSKQAAPQEAPTGNLPAVSEQANAFRKELAARQKAYMPLLPPHVPWEKFQASVWAAIQNNPDLLQCNRATLFKACAEAAELGLSLNPSLREADILKVWDGRISGYAAQFRPRFMGYMKLAKQSGEIRTITAHEVYEWDQFDWEHGLHEHLTHKPGKKPTDYAGRPHWGVIAVYCVWEEIDGTKKFEVMDIVDIIRIMNRSTAKNKQGEIVGPWINDFPEMCRKTVVRRASKYMPLSAEKMKPFANAVNLDDRREGGENVELREGEVIDITDSGDAPPEQPKPSAAGKSQMDDLETRMTGKPTTPLREQDPATAGRNQARTSPPTINNPPQPQPPAIARIEVPRSNGAADWVTWLRLSEAAVSPMDESARRAWRDQHKDLLDNCEFNVPDEMEALIKMLPRS